MIDNRLLISNGSFDRLYKCVWNPKNLKNKTEICVYMDVVLTTLLNCSETWVIYYSHIFLLMRCLCTILNIHWSDFVTNIEVVEQAEITGIEDMSLKYHHLWSGYASRMESHHLQKITLYYGQSTGHRERGAQMKR